MLHSRRYLTWFIILLVGQLQGGKFTHTTQVTGFLHQSVCLTVENEIESSSVQTIQWQRGKKLIIHYVNNETETPVTIFPMYKGRVTYIAENNSLIIHQLSLWDEGDYRVTTTSPLGLEKVSVINLTVLVPVSEPSITVWVQDIPYSKVTMNCTVENGSNPQFSWMKDNASLLLEPWFQLSADYRSLAVINLTSSDCGVYVCSVQNPVNRVRTQQLITGERFQACLQPLSQLRYVAIVLCILFVFTSIVTLVVIKTHRKRQRGFQSWRDEQDPFTENEIENERNQADLSTSADGPQSSLYTYLRFIPSNENQKSQEPSQCRTPGPQL
ncbi:hepatic and glial cell adhesion molecule a [Stegostoma tigrinum]|uniref:hepatic and glial cell adhesion molecule a n=1 Tax=Stegostoma tigrinum TaxID=3053191 RepID=UPI0028707BA2|nr:hepatic and glial cell adhesion molecule a [Stegostoma tigrinum]